MSRRAADLTPEQLARRRELNRDYMARARGNGTAGTIQPGRRPRPPTPEALAERDHRFGVVLTLNQLYLGDPLPGRSALDKLRAQSYTGNLTKEATP